jgi:hypothetical protein
MQTRRWTLSVDTLTALLTRPGFFYTTRFGQVTTLQALTLLTVSGLFFAMAGTLLRPERFSLAMGLILFINAIGNAVIGCTACYLILVATARRRYAFNTLLSIFSLSSGTVLLIAWVPSALFLTEPWKWWLIGTGMVNGLGMSKGRAVITVLLTVAVVVILISALLLVATHTRACFF